jgi:internalin A
VELKPLTKLTELWLTQTPVTGTGLRHLHSLPALGALTITVKGVEILKNLTALAELRLHSSRRITDDALPHLAGLSRLRLLNLADTSVTGSEFSSLRELMQLSDLDLHGCPVTDDGLRKLKDMRSLRVLDLRNSRVTDRGLSHLKELKTLTVVDLSGTAVTQTGLADLQLALPKCQISPAPPTDADGG